MEPFTEARRNELGSFKAFRSLECIENVVAMVIENCLT